MRYTVKNLEVDEEKDYYKTLGVKKDTPKNVILYKGNELIKFLTSEDAKTRFTDEDVYNHVLTVTDAMNVLTDDEARKIVDLIAQRKEAAKAAQEAEEAKRQAEQALHCVAKDNERFYNNNNKKKNEVAVVGKEANGSKNVKGDKDTKVEELLELINEIENDNKKETNIKKDKEDGIALYEKFMDALENFKEKFGNYDKEAESKAEHVEDKAVKVEKTEEADKKTSNTAKYVAAALGTGLLLFSIMVSCQIIEDKSAEKAELKDANKDNDENIEYVIDEGENIEVEEADQEATIATNIDDVTVSENTEESYDVAYDANSEEVIQAVTDELYNAILVTYNEDLIYKFDRATVEDLVRYTRDNSCISIELFYNELNLLYQNGVDITIPFIGLDSRDYIQRLYRAVTNINEDNGLYNDEYNAYLAMGNAMDNIDPKNNAEVATVRLCCDYGTYFSTMITCRGGEGSTTGEEGIEYIDELTRVHTDIKKECADIYNLVRNDDPNSLLMKYTNDAVNSQSLGR